jgi:protein SCO1/2
MSWNDPTVEPWQMSETRQKSPRLLLIAALVLSVSITTGSLLFVIYQLGGQSPQDTGAAIVDPANYFDGATVYDPPRQVADFSLTGNDGRPLRLSDLAGKVTLIYFGYTNCPDICPATLNTFRRVKEDLGAAADRLHFLMITVDGIRDTPAQMRDFLAEFDSEFLGLTGDIGEVSLVGESFELYFQANPGENYTVDHTAAIFMVDGEGYLRSMFSFGTEAAVITEDVLELLNQ